MKTLFWRISSVVLAISLLVPGNLVLAKVEKSKSASLDANFVCPDHEKGRIVIKAKENLLDVFARKRSSKGSFFGLFKKKGNIVKAQNLGAENFDVELFKYLKKSHKGLKLKKARKSYVSRVDKTTTRVKNLNSAKKARQTRIRSLRKKYGIGRFYKIRVKEKNCLSLMRKIAKLNADPNIEYAEFVPVVEPTREFNDPGLIRDGETLTVSRLWGLSKIKALEAWDHSLGEGVVIGINDTGIDYNHPDLWDNIWVNPNIISDVNEDGKVNLDDADINGDRQISSDEIIPFMFGYDFGDDDPDPMDNDSFIRFRNHGTHVAGIAAAVADNNLGVVGVAPGAKLLPLKGFSSNGFGLDEGIEYATQLLEDGIVDNMVVNNSWGSSVYSEFYREVFEFAYQAGVINVNAAGNDRNRALNTSPSGLSTMIVVGSSTIDDTSSFFTNHGTVVDVVAPGSSVLSTFPVVSGSYQSLSGTSMASPHVAGLIALILEDHPEYGIEEIRSILRSTTDENNFTEFDRGVVDAAAAVTATNEYPLAHIYSQQNPDENITQITGTADDMQDFQKYVLEYARGIYFRNDAPAQWTQLLESSTPVRDAVLLDDLSSYALAADDLTFRLSVYDDSGNVSTKLMYFDGRRVNGSVTSFEKKTDLTVAWTVSTERVPIGGTFAATVSVSNNRPDAEEEGVESSALVRMRWNTAYNIHSLPSFCSLVGRFIHCNVNDLGIDETRDFNVVYQNNLSPDPGEEFRILVYGPSVSMASVDVEDVDLNNNIASPSVRRVAAFRPERLVPNIDFDLSVESLEQYNENAIIPVTFTASNVIDSVNGDAAESRVTINISNDFEYESFPSFCNNSSRRLSCELDALEPGASQELQIFVKYIGEDVPTGSVISGNIGNASIFAIDRSNSEGSNSINNFVSFIPVSLLGVEEEETRVIDLDLSVRPLAQYNEDSVIPVSFQAANIIDSVNGAEADSDVLINLNSAEFELIAAPAFCVTDVDQLTCSLGTLDPQVSTHFDIEVRYIGADVASGNIINKNIATARIVPKETDHNDINLVNNLVSSILVPIFGIGETDPEPPSTNGAVADISLELVSSTINGTVLNGNNVVVSVIVENKSKRLDGGATAYGVEARMLVHDQMTVIDNPYSDICNYTATTNQVICHWDHITPGSKKHEVVILQPDAGSGDYAFGVVNSVSTLNTVPGLEVSDPDETNNSVIPGLSVHVVE